MKCLKNILNNFEFMTPTKPQNNYFRFDGFSFGGLLEYILQHALAKFQPATTCNSQNTSQNTQKHQKHAILLSKPVALYHSLGRTLWLKESRYIGQLLFAVYVAMGSSLGHQPTRNQSS